MLKYRFTYLKNALAMPPRKSLANLRQGARSELLDYFKQRGRERITGFISANPSLGEAEKERDREREAKQNFETRTANDDAKCAF